MANEKELATCPKCGSAMVYEGKPPTLDTFVCDTQTYTGTDDVFRWGQQCLRSQLTQAQAKRYEYAGLLKELASKPPRAITRDGEEYCGLCGRGSEHADYCLLVRTKQALEPATPSEEKGN